LELKILISLIKNVGEISRIKWKINSFFPNFMNEKSQGTKEIPYSQEEKEEEHRKSRIRSQDS
jgi:hypothetical protein